jgi:hypothetical protein
MVREVLHPYVRVQTCAVPADEQSVIRDERRASAARGERANAAWRGGDLDRPARRAATQGSKDDQHRQDTKRDHERYLD